VLALFVAGQTLFSVVNLNWSLITGEASNLVFAVSFVVALAAIFFIWKNANLLSRLAQGSIAKFAQCSEYQWVMSCILIGVLLRIAWVSVFQAPLRSDYATYFSLAQSLAERGTYQVSNSAYAFWPPGYPLFLSVFLVIFGSHAWVVSLVNLVLFGASVAVGFHLARVFLDDSAARLATFLLVFWPSSITSTGLASKEGLVCLLLPLAVVLFFAAAKRVSMAERYAFRFVAGVAFGFGSLAQPSVLFFPSILLIYEWLAEDSQLLRKFLPIALGMMVTIGPWTLRNYFIFGELVPISTNGGDVLYRANNPLATGGYMAAGPQSFEHLDELARNKVAFRLGFEWIVSNPAEFLKLALKKQILFLGDDAHGVFETLKRGLGITDRRYVILKAIANMYWLLIWVSISAGLVNHIKKGLFKNRGPVILMLACFYFLAIHSIFESAGRYHEPLTIFIALLVTLILPNGDVPVRYERVNEFDSVTSRGTLFVGET